MTPSNLKLCPDCEKPISRRAAFCPHCGAPDVNTADEKRKVSEVEAFVTDIDMSLGNMIVFLLKCVAAVFVVSLIIGAIVFAVLVAFYGAGEALHLILNPVHKV